jgi:putative NADH-flavin reductase
MRVTVFGASGKVGQLVVRRLLADGHYVTAFVYKNASFAAQDKLAVMRGDAHNQADVDEALGGAEAVISALGSWGTPSKDILSSAMHTIIPAMEARQINRLVSLTGHVAAAPGENLRLTQKISRAGLNLAAQEILADGEQHMRLLAKSKLDWTVIRSPVMTNSANTKYYLGGAPLSPLATIARPAVVRAMTEQLTSQDYLRAAPHIHKA